MLSEGRWEPDLSLTIGPQRKPSGIGEEIQDSDGARFRSPRDELTDSTPILSLVEEGSRLLASDEIDHEGHAVLLHFDLFLHRSEQRMDFGRASFPARPLEERTTL